MTAKRPSGVQRLMLAFVSAERAAAIEAESRAWMARCGDCGAERSIWELGGIRYRATGKPRMLLRCPKCGTRGWHRIERATDAPTHNP